MFENTCNTDVFGAAARALADSALFGAESTSPGASVGGQALTLILMAVILSVPDLPFELYSQFVIEQEYGFNKSSLKLWVVDKIKSLFVGLILGAPILTLILWFSETFKTTWWLWGFLAVSVFQVAMIVVYPRLIMPLFNKLEDLPEGDLRTALFAVAEEGRFSREHNSGDGRQQEKLTFKRLLYGLRKISQNSSFRHPCRAS